MRRLFIIIISIFIVFNNIKIDAHALSSEELTEISTMINLDEKYITILEEIYGCENIASISYDIVSLMSQRYNYNRGSGNVYFISLNESAKLDIMFYEALLLYNKVDVYTVNKLLYSYESIINTYNKIDKTFNTNFDINIAYSIQCQNLGLGTDDINILCKAFKQDSCLNGGYNIEDLYTQFIIPFRLNENSIENLMLSGTSLIGKVRYIWGGGHGITYHLDGINPYWFQWDKYYDNLDSCIKPSGSYCIIHGESDGLCSTNNTIYSLDEYIASRSEIYNINDKYTSILNELPLYNGVPEHNFDGLDCSGYVSWVYAQLSDKYYIESSAMNISNLTCFSEIPLGEQLICGDVFAWAKHVVLIVGKSDKSARAYVTLEQTPNSVKFGVLHYEDASYASINKAYNIASQANIVFGNITNENPHTYCIDNVKYYEEVTEGGEPILDDDGQPIYSEFAFIGRCIDSFNDDKTKLKTEYATDIIQHTIDNTLISYLDGYKIYDGDLFTFDKMEEAFKIKQSLE